MNLAGFVCLILVMNFDAWMFIDLESKAIILDKIRQLFININNTFNLRIIFMMKTTT